MELLGDELDPAHWAQLCSGPDHYPGGGAAVPEVLRGLADARDLEEARQWGDRLWDLLFHSHSGAYLRPAEHVVPHLVRLGTADPGSVRAGARAVALGFLVYLGTGWAAVADRCPEAAGLEARVREAVRAPLPAYYAQLEATDPWLRATAFILVTVLEHEALLRLTGSARAGLEAGPPITSARYRRTVEWLHEHDGDPTVRWQLKAAKKDPLFGHGEEWRGVMFEY